MRKNVRSLLRWAMAGATAGAVLLLPARAAVDPAALIREISERPATLGAPLAVSNLDFQTRAATFDFDDGLLFPASPVGGEPVEMVFIGRGRMRFETGDPVEMDHLELHSGQRNLSTHFTEAVLVIADADMRQMLLGSPPASAPAGARGPAALQRYQNWLKSGERRLLGVDTGLFRAAIAEPGAGSFFAAWLGGTEWEDIWYGEDPEDVEPVAIGRFLTIDPEGTARRKFDRELARQQRRGRLQAISPEDVGHVEQWVSTTVDGEHKATAVGDAAFEPERYVIDATIDARGVNLAGTAELFLRARQEGRRSLRLRLGLDFKVEGIEDGAGTPLTWMQTRGTIMVLLPTPVKLGTEVRLRVRYSGSPFERAKRGTYAMRDTIDWHPHAGQVDRARYDVTIRWPWSLNLAAAGTRVDGGRGDGMQWERRRLDFPSVAFGFELGGFEYRQVQAGHIRLTMAYGRGEESVLTHRQEEMEAEIVDILAFYEEIFGRLPIDEMTVATLPRDYGQSLLGFMTLGSGMIDERQEWEEYWRTPDRKTYLAHELAHQWWGHLVGWRSYRDQWLSESLAHHSAMLYSRRRLQERHRYDAGPLSNWSAALLRVDRGRTVESVGPVVLGQRLDSYLGISAYEPIVYMKGGLVMDMLARRFTDNAAFPTMLSHLVTAARNQPISTEEFLAALEKMSGADLDSFARQFIYGTGLPYVVYDYTITAAAPGAKSVTRGQARLFAPPSYSWRIESVPGGGFDLRRRPDRPELQDGMGLVMPFQLDLGKGYMHGRLPLRGHLTPFQLESEQTPTHFWLDVRGEIFARSISLQTRPKTARLILGRLLRSAGKDDEAEKYFLEARGETDLRDLAPGATAAQARDEPPGKPDRDGLSKVDHAKVLRDIDLEIMDEMATLYLDRGRLEEAGAILGEMQALMEERHGFGWNATREGSVWELDDGGGEVNRLTASLQARLDLLEGRPAEILKTFRKAVEAWGRLKTGENYALLAIAAHQTGDAKAFRDYREKARTRGVDMTALTAAPTPAPAPAPAATAVPTPPATVGPSPTPGVY